ncbi:MAG: hypothetical protein EXQ96_03135 [Alphaproteobacteria bacterium]|nr:hypothetical protein [Alphaproteobacteria bacterium]
MAVIRPAHAALLLGLAACASAEVTAVAAGGVPLSSALVADRALAVIEGFTGAAYALFLAPDGGLEVQRGGTRDTGRWWVDERGRLCWLEAWAAADGPLCQRVVERAGLYQMFRADGSLGLTVARIDRGRELPR